MCISSVWLLLVVSFGKVVVMLFRYFGWVIVMMCMLWLVGKGLSSLVRLCVLLCMFSWGCRVISLFKLGLRSCKGSMVSWFLCRCCLVLVRLGLVGSLRVFSSLKGLMWLLKLWCLKISIGMFLWVSSFVISGIRLVCL